MQGYQPSTIATRLGITRRQTYRLLKKATPDYIPTDRISDSWKSARTTIVRLLTSLGIEGKELAEWLNVDDGTISHYKYSTPGGTPVIKIELMHDTDTTTGELLKAGAYSVGVAGKSGYVCLHSLTTNRLHFVTGADLQGDIRILEISGVDNGR
jgi:hypothetical protein